MSQIQRKWLADGIINSAKIDPTSIMVFAGANLTGPLGIGTTAPADDIDIVDSARPPAIRMEYTGGVGPYEIYQINADASRSLNIADITQGSTRMTLNYSGLLGIGTTNPTSDLHIQRTSGSVTVDLDNKAVNGVNFQLNSNTLGHFGLANVDTLTQLVTVDATGSVGIGTTIPYDPLHIRVASNPSDLRLDSAGGSGRAYVLRSNTDGGFYLIDDNNSATRYWVGPTGNFNITGDTTMVGGLKVNGTTTIVNTEIIVSNQLLVSQSSDASVVGIYTMSGSTQPALTIHNNGTGPALTTDNGNIGIGITNPSYKLHVVHNANAETGIYVSNTTAGASAAANIAATSGSGRTTAMLALSSVNTGVYGGLANNNNLGMVYSSNTAGLLLDQYANANLYLATNNVIRMTVTAAGNVGIGITTTSYLLEMVASGNGQMRISDTLNSSSGQVIIANNAGVGLTIASYGNTAGDSTMGQAMVNGSLVGTNGSLMVIGTTVASPVYFGTNNATRMTITATTGLVGIGTTNPGVKLDVIGEGRFRGTGTGSIVLSALNSSSNEMFQFQQQSDGRGVLSIRQSGGGTSTVVLDGNGSSYFTGGSVGIGSISPNNLLDVSNAAGPATVRTGTGQATAWSGFILSGDAAYSPSTNGYLFRYGSTFPSSIYGTTGADAVILHGGNTVSKVIIGTPTATNAPIYLATNGSIRMTIDYSGNVGIGSASPIVALDVVGSTNISGSVGIGSASPHNLLDVYSVVNPSTVRTGTAQTAAWSGFILSGDAAYNAVTNSSLYRYGSAYGGSIYGTPAANAVILHGGNTVSKLIIGTPTAVPIYLATNGSIRATIDSAGNVGIGSIVPGYNLDVAGTVGIGSTLNMTGGVASSTINVQYGGSTKGSIIAGSGSFSLNNANSAIMSLTATGGDLNLASYSSEMHFKTNTFGSPITAMTVSTAYGPGNIGVGTTSPTRSLDVQQYGATDGGVNSYSGYTINAPFNSNVKVVNGTFNINVGFASPLTVTWTGIQYDKVVFITLYAATAISTTTTMSAASPTLSPFIPSTSLYCPITVVDNGAVIPGVAQVLNSGIITFFRLTAGAYTSVFTIGGTKGVLTSCFSFMTI